MLKWLSYAATICNCGSRSAIGAADTLRRLATAQQEIEHLQGEIRKLQAERFGRRSEKQSTSDRSNQLDDPANTTPKRPRGRQPGQPAPRRRDYSHLPARKQVIDLPEADKVCPSCGKPLSACDSEDSEQLEIDMVVFRRVIQRRRYQRTCDCPGPRTRVAPAAANARERLPRSFTLESPQVLISTGFKVAKVGLEPSDATTMHRNDLRQIEKTPDAKSDATTKMPDLEALKKSLAALTPEERDALLRRL